MCLQKDFLFFYFFTGISSTIFHTFSSVLFDYSSIFSFHTNGINHYISMTTILTKMNKLKRNDNYFNKNEQTEEKMTTILTKMNKLKRK